MFAIQVNPSLVRTVVCFALAVLIVSASLAVGAMGVESMASAARGVVTITQIA
jgi:hypothetical protein